MGASPVVRIVRCGPYVYSIRLGNNASCCCALQADQWRWLTDGQGSLLILLGPPTLPGWPPGAVAYGPGGIAIPLKTTQSRQQASLPTRLSDL